MWACEQAQSERLDEPGTQYDPVKTERMERERQLLVRELKLDARKGRNMRLDHFGEYMKKRWPYYAAKGNFAFKDEAIRIEITAAEILIEKPEGKLIIGQEEIASN